MFGRESLVGMRRFSISRRALAVTAVFPDALVGIIWAWLTFTAPALTFTMVRGPKPPGSILVSVQATPMHFDGTGQVTPARGGLWELDLKRGSSRQVTEGLGIDLRVSPDGRFVAYHDDLDRMWIRPLDGGEPRMIPNLLGPPVWSPNSATIVMSHHSRAARGSAPSRGAANLRLDARSLRLEPIPVPADEEICDWSPDGTWLLVVAQRKGNRTSVRLRSVDGKESRDLTDGESLDINPRFSPDGGQVAFCRFSGGSAAVYRIKTDGTELRRVVDGLTETVSPSWSPDGTALLVRAHHAMEIVSVDGRERGPLTLRVKKPFDLLDPQATLNRDPLYLGGAEWVSGGRGRD